MTFLLRNKAKVVYRGFYNFLYQMIYVNVKNLKKKLSWEACSKNARSLRYFSPHDDYDRRGN
jgi:hypothetical protein